MPNDDSRDTSKIPWTTNWTKWWLGCVGAAMLAAVLYRVDAVDRVTGLFDPAPKVLGRAPWDGEVTSDFKRAIPLLESAIGDANRGVLTVREGLLFHETDESYHRRTGRTVYYPPCRVYELFDRFRWNEMGVRQKVNTEGFIFRLRDDQMKKDAAIGFEHNDETDYDLIFHFYKDDKLLAVLGWINGAAVVRGWSGVPPPKNYLRWIDGGWQGDLALSGEGAAHLLFAWLISHGVRTVSEGTWSH